MFTTDLIFLLVEDAQYLPNFSKAHIAPENIFSVMEDDNKHFQEHDVHYFASTKKKNKIEFWEYESKKKLTKNCRCVCIPKTLWPCTFQHKKTVSFTHTSVFVHICCVVSWTIYDPRDSHFERRFYEIERHQCSNSELFCERWLETDSWTSTLPH